MAALTALVFQLSVLVLSGIIIGRLLDSILGSFPLMHIVFIVLGLSLGVYRILQADKHLNKTTDEPDP